jgi:hypothetical protein
MKKLLMKLQVVNSTLVPSYPLKAHLYLRRLVFRRLRTRRQRMLRSNGARPLQIRRSEAAPTQLDGLSVVPAQS